MITLMEKVPPYIIFHCSASDNPEHDDVKIIKKWHIARGFSDIGYHFFIQKRMGLCYMGRPLGYEGAHTKGHNDSLGICLSGDKVFNDVQFAGAAKIILDISQIYPHLGMPHNWKEHRYFNKNKTCPNFEVHRKILPYYLQLLREKTHGKSGWK